MLVHFSTILLTLTSLVFILSGISAAPAQQQQQTPTPSPTAVVILLSPTNGQVLQGSVPVQIQASSAELSAVELSFGYSDDPTGTWFIIQQDQTLNPEQPFARWDTTILTDGNYTLRILVTFPDNKQFEARAIGLRVRNYSPIETNTPTPVTPTTTPEPGELPTVTLTPTATITLTPTLLPTNPSEMSSTQITSSLGRGALAAGVLFIFLGLFFSLRRARFNNRQK